MEYEIYIDVFAFTGFGMDLLALFLTDVCLNRGRRIRGLIAASLFGTVAGILLFFLLTDYGIYTMLIHFLVNPCMVYLAFREKSGRGFMEDWGVTYLAVLLTGGVMQWIYQTMFGGRYRMAAMLLTVLPGLIGAAVFRRRRMMGNNNCEVRLVCGEQSVLLYAYYDTGNLLTDPYTRLPVSIVSWEAAGSLFNKKAPAGRLIPYVSMGEEHGLLEAYTIDKMLVYRGKHERTIAPAVIGMAKEQLFTGKEYQMILNGQL